MRKTPFVLTLLAAVSSLSIAHNASALSINDANYLGNYYLPQPAGQAEETMAVQNLINWFNDDGTYVSGLLGRTYDLSDNPSPVFSKPLPDATYGDKLDDLPDDTDGAVDVTGIDYVIGKYANVISHVWYVGNLTGLQYVSLEIKGLSHITRFSGTDVPPGNSVPDGGATVALLGLGITGLAFMRRRKV